LDGLVSVVGAFVSVEIVTGTHLQESIGLFAHVEIKIIMGIALWALNIYRVQSGIFWRSQKKR